MAKQGSARADDWIVGRVSLPVYVSEGTPLRPDMLICLCPIGMVGAQAILPHTTDDEVVDAVIAMSAAPAVGSRGRTRLPRCVVVELRNWGSRTMTLSAKRADSVMVASVDGRNGPAKSAELLARIAELEADLDASRAKVASLRLEAVDLRAEKRRLREENERLSEENEAQRRANQELRDEIKKLKRCLEETRRKGKRQAAPFRRRERKANPKKPGRKPGHAPAQRPVPDHVDAEVDVPLVLAPIAAAMSTSMEPMSSTRSTCRR